MALVAMTTSDVVEFVSEKDPARKKVWRPIDPNDKSKGEIEDTEIGTDATVFGLKPLDVFLMGYIYDNASHLSGEQGSTKVGIQTRINQTNIDAVRFGLAWVKNFQDKKGEPVRLKHKKVEVNGRNYDAVDDASMNKLGIHLVQELADKIKEISEVSAEEEKNSEGASLQSA